MRSSNVQGFVSTVPTLYEEEEDYAPLYRNRRMRSSNVQGFASMVPTLYEEEEDYAPLYRYSACAVQFLHYIPL